MSFIDKYYYKNFTPLYEGVKTENWCGKNPVFEQMVSWIKPKTIIEVGTWKGNSTIQIANATKKHNLDSTIFCVDTWLGGIDIEDKFTKKRFGYPTVYFDFLTNVINSDCQDIIIPVPNTSKCCYQMFKKNKIKAQLIFIDASHQEEDVYDDLCNYGELLEEGGKLFGHDWQWVGVNNAVTRYAKENNRIIDQSGCGQFWILI